jgi:hypothetical protein
VLPETGGPAPDLNQVLQDASGSVPPTDAPKRPTSQLAPGDAEEESYTSRLLKAKQQAVKNRPKDNPKDE